MVSTLQFRNPVHLSGLREILAQVTKTKQLTPSAIKKKQQSYPHGLSHQQHYEPQRLSGIYQYHNAPEVLPEHGLEYDDTTYPTSDKYPVTHSMDDHNSTFHNMQAAAAAAITRGGSVSTQQYLNKPPRIIFGMKLRSFLLVALVFVLIVVGAVVGGTVGRNSAKLTGTTAAGEQQQSGYVFVELTSFL
jgi:hypothetical protein